MSKYHELRTTFVRQERDWTTEDGIAAALRDVLELSGYGTEFQVFRDDSMPVDACRIRHRLPGS